MTRRLLILLALALAPPLSAQTPSKSAATEVIDALAAKLSVPAAHLWVVLVKQAAIEFWTTLIAAIVLSVAAVFLIRAALKEARREKGMFEDGLQMALFMASALATLGAVAMVLSAIQEVGYLINPEYYALTKILGAFK